MNIFEGTNGEPSVRYDDAAVGCFKDNSLVFLEAHNGTFLARIASAPAPSKPIKDKLVTTHDLKPGHDFFGYLDRSHNTVQFEILARIVVAGLPQSANAGKQQPTNDSGEERQQKSA